MSVAVRPIGNDPWSILWVAREDPYACRDRFFDASRAGVAVNVYDMVTWELDYLRLLFPDATWSWTDDVARLGALKPDVVVFNSNTFALDESTFSEWTPRILVYLSDEWGRTPDVHRHTEKIPLVLRQHHHLHYFQASNVRRIPLGFMNTMFDDPLVAPDVPPATERPYRWSFVGGLKGDRAEALQTFEPWGPYLQGSHPPHECARIYQNSKFVLCPRGNVAMDCFRNYEATICGAIPVVAGCSKREYLQSFAQLAAPPWVHAPTWREARMICADLEETGAIEELQQACLEWWRTQVLAIRQVIADARLDHCSGKEGAASLSNATATAAHR